VDVAAVFAEVDGDAVGPAQLGLVGGPHGVGLALGERITPVAGLSHGRNVIDVHAELDHAEG
jgi:hypothetical protein